MRILAVGFPSSHGTGGDRRTLMALLEYHNFGVQVYLHIPYRWIVWKLISSADREKFAEDLLQDLENLKQKGVIIPNVLIQILEASRSKQPDSIESFYGKRKHPYLAWMVDSMFHSGIQGEDQYLNNFLNETGEFDIIYQMSETVEFLKDSVLIGKIRNAPIVILLQAKAYGLYSTKYLLSSLSIVGVQVFSRFLWDLLLYPYRYFEYRKMISSGRVKCILAVSSTCLSPGNFKRMILSNKIPFKVLSPPNAIESDLPEGNFEKKEEAIFFARLALDKGIFDVPNIMRLAENRFKLKVYGRFATHREETTFVNSIKGLNVDYKGYAKREVLLSEIANSKAFVYPTHADAFPLTVIEAIKLGCIVIAYDTPALHYYVDFPTVELVKEFDIKSMAKKILEIMNTPKEDLISLFEETEVKEFIEAHSSWKKVSEAEISLLHDQLKSFNDLEPVR